MAQHSTTTYPEVANREAVRIDFAGFREEGAEFQQRFRDRLTTVLGPERVDVFWTQAEPVFRDVFNDFGAHGSAFQLSRSENGLVEFYTQKPRSSRIGNVRDLRGQGIPKPLQAIAQEWLAAAASQRAGGSQ